MKLMLTSALAAALAIVPALARAQDEGGYVAAETEATPDGAAPSYAPPAPPVETPAAPQAQPQQAAPVPPGQWVYTDQYGWIWMPYADAYTSVPSSGWGEPYAYVYYPAYATWTWVAAPWIWGIGPWPVFGVWGPARFGWYGHGWWRSPGRWHYAPAHAWYPGGGWRTGYRGGGAVWNAPRFGPGRGGHVVGGPVMGGRAFVGGGHGFVGGGHGGGGGRGFAGGGHGGGGGGGRGGGGGHHR